MKHATMALSFALASALGVVAGCDADRRPGPTSDQPHGAAAPEDRRAAASPTPSAPSALGSHPNTTIPAIFQGTWAADAIACGEPAHESRLTLQANRVAFYEGAGPVKSAIVDGNDITVLAQLLSEGQTDETTYAFHLSDDGNTLTDISTGPGMVRQRCPATAR